METLMVSVRSSLSCNFSSPRDASPTDRPTSTREESVTTIDIVFKYSFVLACVSTTTRILIADIQSQTNRFPV